ncbi:MAG: prepilin-type N-terminal cleavage/methylation domain-containing protein [Desulfobacterales bacterium]|jgi:prepilin-type N-terminal cleavage/methylation domain-containing protein
MKSDPIETIVRKISGNRGFTLIETLIAIAIFSIGILAVGSMQISAINNNASARMRTEATIYASELAEDMMSWDYSTDLDPADPPNFPPLKDIYCVQTWITDDTPIPSTKTITLSVRWTDEETGCVNFNQKQNEVRLDFIKANI